ncbi:MAG: hypothetical protein ABIM21_05520 [candidate division WOR-3 bacterium]
METKDSVILTGPPWVKIVNFDGIEGETCMVSASKKSPLIKAWYAYLPASEPNTFSAQESADPNYQR